jgi:nucleoside-diphosphate-sugar epimerase
MSNNQAELHVIFGGGQVGLPLARMLAEQGKRVRLAKRSAVGILPGIEVLHGDATDARFCAKAAEGATAIYHCMNPPYEAKAWASLLPVFMDNLVAAAGRAGARLVVLDNVYMLGRPAGKALDETTPMNPCSRKGETRAQVTEQLLAAHTRGDVEAITGRAADFYGPGGTLTHVGDQFWPAALAGKVARLVVDPDALHTYHYIPDVAQGLATLAGAENADTGQAWMLPCAPAGTLRELIHGFSEKLGKDIRISVMPRWMMRGLGLFVGILRELNEMAYQWDEPFVINDQKFRARFGGEPALQPEADTQTVAWARDQYPH